MRQLSKAGILSGVTTLVVMSLLAGPAAATPVGTTLLVDDFGEQPLGLHLSGPTVENSSIQITQEGIGVLGGADAHFEYTTTDANPPAVGQTLTFNFNIYEDNAHTILSDTWNIVINRSYPNGQRYRPRQLGYAL